MRRRQRRLRSWWRHEQQSIAAVLATASRHSHSKVDTANDGLREQKTVTSTREEVEFVKHAGRPGTLAEPSDRTMRRSAGEAAPTLGLPVLAEASGEAVDATSVRHLLKMSLALQTKLEEEEEEQKRRRGEASPRRTKKRKKKKLLRGGAGLQLSKLKKVKVPQVQWLVRVLDIPVWHSEGYSQCWLGLYCASGGSGSTCCVVIFFTVNNGHWFQPSAWHTPRVGSDHCGTALFDYNGTCVHIRAVWSSSSLSVSSAAMVSQTSWQRAACAFCDFPPSLSPPLPFSPPSSPTPPHPPTHPPTHTTTTMLNDTSESVISS